jgi:hypothetical protein
MRGIFVCVVLANVFWTTGCYRTPDGRSRVGVPGVRDRWVSAYERSPDQVRDAVLKVLENMGQLTLNDYVNNAIEARVDTKFVSIQIIPLESGLTQIITQVRSRSGLPDTNLAREIDKQVALQLPRFQTPISGGAGAVAPISYRSTPAPAVTSYRTVPAPSSSSTYYTPQPSQVPYSGSTTQAYAPTTVYPTARPLK